MDTSIIHDVFTKQNSNAGAANGHQVHVMQVSSLLISIQAQNINIYYTTAFSDGTTDRAFF